MDFKTNIHELYIRSHKIQKKKLKIQLISYALFNLGVISYEFLILQPKYTGIIIDIVSRDIRTPEQQSEAFAAVKNAVLSIVLIVILGYVRRIYHIVFTSLISIHLSTADNFIAFIFPIRLDITIHFMQDLK